MFHAATSAIHAKKADLVNRLAPRLLTSDMAQSIVRVYPQLCPILNFWMVRGEVARFPLRSGYVNYGEAHSTWVDFIAFALLTISRSPNFVTEARSRPYSWSPDDENGPLQLTNTMVDPWRMPESDHLERLCSMVNTTPRNSAYWDEMDYSFSAPPCAFRFINSLDVTARKSIRNIRLLDDQKSVANCAGHTRSLIRFCLENRNLRLEHLVDLWTTVFPIRLLALGNSPPGYQRSFQLSLYDNERLQAADISKALGIWISECLALHHLGMPEASYRLTFDGGTIPN